MVYEIPVYKGELKYRQFKSSIDSKRMVLFRAVDRMDTLFILCHGNDEGLIDANGLKLTPKELLERLIEIDAFKSYSEIKEIKTISCYGGLQEPAVVAGIKISSLHDSKEKIQARSFMGVDGECFLQLNI